MDSDMDRGLASQGSCRIIGLERLGVVPAKILRHPSQNGSERYKVGILEVTYPFWAVKMTHLETVGFNNRSNEGPEARFNKSDTTAPATTADLLRDRPSVSGNPQNIGAVAGELGSHPVAMEDNLDNDHNSSLEDRTPHKNTDATPKGTPQNKGDKQHLNTKFLEAIREQQHHLKQLEQEADRQREAERDLCRETRRR
ncbi:hypothetical protein AHAS_Ahas11G0226200 [Arachis hypogaea]